MFLMVTGPLAQTGYLDSLFVHEQGLSFGIIATKTKKIPMSNVVRGVY